MILFIVPDFSLRSLTLLKRTDSNGQPQNLRLRDQLSTKWRDVGDLLGLTSRLKGIEEQRHCDARLCCRDILLDWLQMDDGSSYPVNWDGMLSLLEDMELSATAKKLQGALKHYQ